MSKKQTSSTGAHRELCKSCGAVLPSKVEQCVVCGAKRKSEPAKPQQNQAWDIMSPAQLNKERRRPRFIAGVLIFALIFSAVGVGTLEYITFQHNKSVYNAGKSIVYQQGDSLNIQMTSSSVDQPFTLDESYSNYSDNIKASASYDNRFVAYLQGQSAYKEGAKGDLYLIDLVGFAEKDKNKDKEESKKLITADKVVDFTFSDREHILYYLTTEGELFSCKYNEFYIFKSAKIEISKIDDNVTGIVKAAGSSLLYYKGDKTNSSTLANNTESSSGNVFDLYKATYAPNKLTILSIDTGVFNIIDCNKDLTKILYSKPGKNGTLTRYPVYYYNSKNVMLLANTVDHVVEANANKGALLYLTGNVKSLNITDLFDYYEESTEISATEGPAVSTVSTERPALISKLVSKIQKFNMENYVSYTLNYIPESNNDKMIIDRNIYAFDDIEHAVSSNLSLGYILYVSHSPLEDKKTNLSGIPNPDLKALVNYPDVVKSVLAEQTPEELTLYTLENSTKYNIYTENGEKVISDYFVSHDLRKIYFMSRTGYGSPYGALYSVNFSGRNVEEIVYIDDYVSHVIGEFKGKEPGLIYQSPEKDGASEYILFNSTTEKTHVLADHTSNPKYTHIVGGGKDLILFFRGYSSNRGNLYFYDSAEGYVAPAISEYAIFSNGNMVLTQYENGKTNLLSYINGDIEMVAQDVGSYFLFDAEFFPAEN